MAHKGSAEAVKETKEEKAMAKLSARGAHVVEQARSKFYRYAFRSDGAILRKTNVDGHWTILSRPATIEAYRSLCQYKGAVKE